MSGQNRSQNFKNNGINENEMRHHRSEVTVELRKNKREEAISIRRKIPNMDLSTDEEDQQQIDIYLMKLAKTAKDSSQPELQFAAVQATRVLFASDKIPSIGILSKSNILQSLVDCLKQSDTNIQYEAAWALTNIASDTSEHTNEVVAVGAAPIFIQLLSSPAPKVREQSVWALGNIIGDGPYLRDYIISLGVIQPLVSFIRLDVPISFLYNVTWVILNLCRNQKPPPPQPAILQILPALNMLIYHTDTNILVDTVWALSYLTDGGTDQIQMLVESNVVPKFIPLFGHTDYKVQMAAVRAVGNIVTYSDEQTQVILNSGALSHFPALLTHFREKIRREAMKIVSSIIDGSQSRVQEVIDAGLLPKIIENLKDGEFRTQREAACSIHNLTLNGNRNQVFTLIREGVIGPFCDMLMSRDIHVINVVLKGLNNMLKVAEPHVQDIANLIEECAGFDKIEHLQQHENDDIYKMAFDIIERYFFDKNE